MLDEYSAIASGSYLMQVLGVAMFLAGSWFMRKASQRAQEIEALKDKLNKVEMEVRALSTQLETTNRILNSINDAFIKSSWQH